jgi:protein associated with RNAse G/E
MEVHHHSHPAGHHKKWTHYLWEFLMLFLAVFAGFLAENQREHYVEHHRARDYAASMVSDLRSDTLELKNFISYTAYAAHNIDTLLSLLSTQDPAEIPSGKLYWFGLWGGASRPFVPNDATLQQLKSSGSLRYFSNKQINREMAEYDQLCRRMKFLEENDMMIYAEVRRIRGQIFEFRFNSIANNIAQQNYRTFDQNRIDSFIASNPPLLTYDKSVFNQYVELVRSRFLGRRVTLADTLLSRARILLIDLKKEYRFR